MTETPALKVIRGGSDAKDSDDGPLFVGNSMSVTLSGFSADLLEHYRHGSEQPEEIVAALYKVLDAVRPAAMERQHMRKAFVHQVSGTTAVIVGMTLPAARPISAQDSHTVEES